MKRDKIIYVLDTTAVFTYIENEDGAEFVEKILIMAENNEVDVIISFISLTELYYITLQENDETKALKRIELIKSLAVEIIESYEEYNLEAGKLKAENKISLADAYIAALCYKHQGILVHKDPEFERMNISIKEHRLPYKLK